MISNSAEKRIVITGLGAVTGFGQGVQALRKGLVEGKSCIRKIEDEALSDFKSQVAAMVPAEETEGVATEDKVNRMAHLAASEAIANAEIEKEEIKSCALIGAIGWRWPSQQSVESGQVGSISYGEGLKTLKETLGLGGRASSCLSACAASTQAIGQACDRILNGELNMILVGGADARANPLGMAGYEKLGALAAAWNEEPSKASRPFDKKRNGFVVGEGAGFIVLESLSQAIARNVKVLGEVVGWSSNTDAFRLTDPRPNGEQAKHCIKKCLEMSQLHPQELSWINAHGTSTKANDRMELRALHGALGVALVDTPIVAMKSLFGHLSMAAGVVETIGTVLMFEENVIPKTLNFHEGDSDLDFSFRVNSVTERLQEVPQVVLKNSFGFGGQNACLLIRSGLENWNE